MIFLLEWTIEIERIYFLLLTIVLTSPRDENRQTLARNVSIMFLYGKVYSAQ